MRSRILSTFMQPDLPAYPTVVAWIDSWKLEWDALDSDNKPRSFEHYANIKLAERIGINRLSHSKLLEFGALCLQWTIPPWPISPRILICGTRAQIDDPHPGDTIVTPDGVWQLDHTYQEHLILNKTEMHQAIPEYLRPTPDSKLASISADSDQSKPNTNPELCSALNIAIGKAGRGLHITNNTDSIDLFLRQFQHRQIAQIMSEHDLYRSLFRQLDLNSDIQFTRFAHQLYQNCVQHFIQKGKIAAADDTLPYMIDTLSKKIKLHALSETNLKKLSYMCYTYDPTFSKKIHCAGSLEQLNTANLCQIGDTFLLPDGVYQINLAGHYKRVLNRQDMLTKIPSQFIPDTTSPVTTTICCNDDTSPGDALTLTQALNLALENTKPSALYLGQDSSAEPKEIQDLIQAIRYLIQTELYHRQCKEAFVLKAVGLKTDAEFMQFWNRTHSQFVDTWRKQHPDQPHVNAKTYFEHFKTTLQQYNRARLQDLSDTELKTLYQQCQIWSPNLSPRILCCHTIPDDYRIGDTIILPHGVYQMRLNSYGNPTQIQIIPTRDIQSYHDVFTHIPTSQTDVLTLDEYSSEEDKARLQTLRDKLNPAIIKHGRGMYLADIEKNSYNSYGTICKALSDLVVQEIKSRLQRQYKTQYPRSIYDRFKTLLSFTGRAATPSDSPSLENRVRALKALQNMDPLARSVQPSPARMLIHSQDSIASRTLDTIATDTDQIISDLTPNLGQNLRSHRDTSKHSVKILRDNTVMMEVSAKTVAVYKPLLQAQINPDPLQSNQMKARLFLKSLGIPPTQGKNKISIRGGYHDLRQAIRNQFAAFKASERQDTELSTTANPKHHSR